MPKVFYSSVQRHVEFERVCSNCGNHWTASFNISFTTSYESSSRKAAKSAEIVMQDEIKDRDENCEVLCSDCSHFSVDAMGRHFHKGYTAGLMKKYKRAAWSNVDIFLGFAWIPILLAFIANLNPLNSTNPVGSLIGLLVFLGLGSVALYALTGLIWGLITVSKVRGKVEILSDDALRELAISCYKKNKNSLHVSLLQDRVRWNPWLSEPLFCKANRHRQLVGTNAGVFTTAPTPSKIETGPLRSESKTGSAGNAGGSPE